jgi:hypothetical protein
MINIDLTFHGNSIPLDSYLPCEAMAHINKLNGDRPPLMMTDILRTLCVRQGVIASSIRKLPYFYAV